MKKHKSEKESVRKNKRKKVKSAKKCKRANEK